VFLGLVGLGAAGVVVGAKVQNWLEQGDGTIEAKDFTGLTSLLPFGKLPLLFDHRQLSRIGPRQVHVWPWRDCRQTVTISTASSLPCRQWSSNGDFQCVTDGEFPSALDRAANCRTFSTVRASKPQATALRFVSSTVHTPRV